MTLINFKNIQNDKKKILEKYLNKVKPNIYFYYTKFAKKYIKSFKDTKFLKFFSNDYAQIKPNLETNIKRKNQNKISKAIKHARVSNMFPYFY